MALWGNRDDLVSTDFTPAAPAQVNIVGTASSEFWTAEAVGGSFAGVSTGTTLVLGDSPVGSGGFAVIEHVIDPNLARICGASVLAAGAGQPVVYSQQPQFLKNDPGMAPSSADGSLGRTQRPVGLSTAEAGATNGTVWEEGVGWVGVTTYMDTTNTLRVKKEILVAMSGVRTGNREYPTNFGG